MQPTTEILERISKDSLTHKEEVFTRLYRYLLRPDIYYQAYQRLYTNKGASTKGINQDTADGFSEAKIEKKSFSPWQMKPISPRQYDELILQRKAIRRRSVH